MATGDSADMAARIKATLPPWFSDANPVIASLVAGCASALSFIYGLYAFAALQTRILTATDGFLDLIAQDFFGPSFRRALGQSDASYRNRIIASLFRQRNTRNAVASVLADLTGYQPDIFEPARPMDTGGYGVAAGYARGGGYGSGVLPFQAFVTAYRPAGSGIPGVAGYGSPSGGYSIASQAEYASINMVSGAVTDADIYAAVESVRPAGTILWVKIANSKPLTTLTVAGSPLTVDGMTLYLN